MDSGPTIGESPHPVFVHERIDLIDVVRGFALFGVLLSNLVWITTDMVLTDARLSQLPTAPLDRIVKPVVEFFVVHKFYTLFSFLFGLGFAIQLSRAEERRYNVVAVYARRVSILAVIGLAAYRLRLVWRHSARLCDRWVRAPGRSTLEHTTSASRWPWHSRSSHARLSVCRRPLRAHLTARTSTRRSARTPRKSACSRFSKAPPTALSRARMPHCSTATLSSVV